MSNKDLDLPSVKEMLATVRCNEIATQAVKDAKKEFESPNAKLQRGAVLDDLGDKIRDHRAKALGTLLGAYFLSTRPIIHMPRVYRRLCCPVDRVCVAQP